MTPRNSSILPLVVRIVVPLRSLLLGCCLVGPQTLTAQHPWQKPLPPRSLAAINEITGPVRQPALSDPIKIVWVWSKHDHAPGFHEYEKVRDKYGLLLKSVEKVDVESVYKFPTDEQWSTADLVVFYLHFDELKAEQYQQMKSFVQRGGGIIALHESMIMRPKGERLAGCIGLAWNEGTSLWGLLPTPFKITRPDHPIFTGFGEQMDLVDEFYWNLTGDQNRIEVLATSQAGPEFGTERPHKPSQLDGEAWPLFWTTEFGKGRVFSSLPGHNLFTYDDAYFRIIFFRAVAWATRQSFDPFKPLVTDGIAVKP